MPQCHTQPRICYSLGQSEPLRLHSINQHHDGGDSSANWTHTGGVTVEDPPIPFSPFSPTDCTMLSHFSFNDFIAVAFPDLARDLDIQI